MKFTVALAALFGISLCSYSPCSRPGGRTRNGNGNWIVGDDNRIEGDDNFAWGNNNKYFGDRNKGRGCNNEITGVGIQHIGSNSKIVGVGHALKGDNIVMYGPQANSYFVRGGCANNIPSIYDRC